MQITLLIPARLVMCDVALSSMAARVNARAHGACRGDRERCHTWRYIIVHAQHTVKRLTIFGVTPASAVIRWLSV